MNLNLVVVFYYFIYSCSARVSDVMIFFWRLIIAWVFLAFIVKTVFICVGSFYDQIITDIYYNPSNTQQYLNLKAITPKTA